MAIVVTAGFVALPAVALAVTLHSRSATGISGAPVHAQAAALKPDGPLGRLNRSQLDPSQLPWHVLTDPIDPAQLTSLPFGDRSFWAQPWRAYLATPPAQTLFDAVGINFNVTPQEAPATAAVLGASGFRRARIEIGWSNMSFSDPTHLADPGSWATVLGALKSNDIRPLILLNANDTAPGPTRSWTAHVIAPAPAGSRAVQLDLASASQIVPGYSGLDSLSGSRTAANTIFSAVSPTGLATLSQPLAGPLGTGGYPATTLRFQPFATPYNSDGTPNASYQRTLNGWLEYVGAVTQEAKAVLGNDNFDVEVWNELGFGSNFLDASKYYQPVPAQFQGTGSVDDQLLADTVGWLRNPINGVPNVGIGDGFADQTPFTAPRNTPAGLTALDKHPYHGIGYYGPETGSLPDQPLNALGQPDGKSQPNGRFSDNFTPTFTSLFPEYYLSGIQTETLIRDMAPITTDIYGTSHGRYAATAPQTTQTWLTETNLDPSGADPRAGDQPNAATLAQLSAADDAHLQAKATLRFLASYVNKGATNIDFYAAKGNPFGLIPDAFYGAVDAGGHPGPSASGVTLAAVQRFLAASGPPATISRPRSLSLTAIADQHNYQQWSGDGTAAHPSLYDREVLAVLPFQRSDTSFAVPVYVMTRNLAQLYDPTASASDVTRYDLPDEQFRISLTGVDLNRVTVSLYDPITGASVPVAATSTGARSVDVTLWAADYPRVLEINDAPAAVPFSGPAGSRAGARHRAGGRHRSGARGCPRASNHRPRGRHGHRVRWHRSTHRRHRAPGACSRPCRYTGSSPTGQRRTRDRHRSCRA